MNWRPVGINHSEIAPLLRPETDLESALLAIPEFCDGLLWGEPRFGHPEGKVVLHVREIMDNIDRLDIDPAIRLKLRLIALVHDTFKNVEDKSIPRDRSRHHAVLARKFLEDYTADEAILDVTELHDEAYYAWRDIYLYRNPGKGERRLQALLERLGENLPFYMLFFQCDTQTGDKTQAPLRWLREVAGDLDL